jgi:hypothetical protein
LVLLVGFFTAGFTGSGLRVTSPSTGRPGAAELGHLTLSGPVYDLTYDQARNSLWFVSMTAGSDLMYQYDIGSDRLSDWPLPESDYNGFLSRVAVAPDGSVWATEAYSLVRLDPATGSVESLTFPQKDRDSTPTALDLNNPSPGTWPCSITFDTDGHALVGRHNVSSLARIDANLNIIGRVPIPPGMVDPGDAVDIHGLIYVAPDAGGRVVVMDEQGRSVGVGPADVTRFAQGPSGVAYLGSAGAGWMTGALGPVISGVAGGPMDRISVGAQSVAVYLHGVGSIRFVSAAEVDGNNYTPPVRTIQVLDPLGQTVSVRQADLVGGLAVDGAGTVWFVDIGPAETRLVHIAM